jgi:hypothetical protein
MLCSILGGPLFHRPNPNCFLKVVNNDKFPTSNTLRKIHSFSRKMKSWWSDGQYKWSYSTSMGDNLMRASLHDVPLNLKPVTSITHCTYPLSLRQNHPTWILTAANTAANQTWYVACDQQWSWSHGELYYYLRNIHLSILGEASTSCIGKNITKVAIGMIHEAKII